jgi:hypothetical protein
MLLETTLNPSPPPAEPENVRNTALYINKTFGYWVNGQLVSRQFWAFRTYGRSGLLGRMSQLHADEEAVEDETARV